MGTLHICNIYTVSTTYTHTLDPAMLLLCVYLFLHVFTTSIKSQSLQPKKVVSCHLPAGQAGACVPIGACSHLTNLISNLQTPIPKNVSLLLRDSYFCSGEGVDIKVCCPLDGLLDPVNEKPQITDPPHCSLQTGAAQCVQYTSCPPFLELLSSLNKPLHPSVPG